MRAGVRFHFAVRYATALLAAGAQRCLAEAPATKPATQSSSALTVAILDFSTDTPGSPHLGSQISEVLTATLSGEPGYTLVDRSSLTRVLKEHELNLTGVVDVDQGTRIGKLVGAKILITGDVFVEDKQIFMFAKAIGTETSLFEPFLIKGQASAGMDPLIVQLAQKIATQLPVVGPKLIAKREAALDPVPALKKILGGKKLPKIAVRFSEKHQPDTPAAHVDPAVETELKMMLTDAGFTVIDGDDTDLLKANVPILITGEAFSEFAAHIGNLVSCTDRVELNVKQIADGKVLLADRDNNRAVDLSENLAGKMALQKSGHILGIHVLQYFADTIPAR